MVAMQDEKREKVTVPYKCSDWLTHYVEIAEHLLRGSPVPVTGEDGRRTIAVFEAVERSARSGKIEPVKYE